MIQLIMDQDTGRSKGYGFITYAEAEDAKKALEQVLYALFSRFWQGKSLFEISTAIFLNCTNTIFSILDERF